MPDTAAPFDLDAIRDRAHQTFSLWTYDPEDPPPYGRQHFLEDMPALFAEIARLEDIRHQLADIYEQTQANLDQARRSADDAHNARATLEQLCRTQQDLLATLRADRNKIARQCADLRDDIATVRDEAERARADRRATERHAGVLQTALAGAVDALHGQGLVAAATLARWRRLADGELLEADRG